MIFLNKKGMDISLNFIILAVLALIALIIVALFFTEGLTNLFQKTRDVGSIQGEQIALLRAKCDYYCATGDKDSWDKPGFAEEYVKAGYRDCNHPDLISTHIWTDGTDTDDIQNDKCD